MPWKTQYVMELRMDFVIKSLQPGANFRALCRETGISPKTGYKWQERFLAEGKAGLADESRRPHPARTKCRRPLYASWCVSSRPIVAGARARSGSYIDGCMAAPRAQAAVNGF